MAWLALGALGLGAAIGLAVGGNVGYYYANRYGRGGGFYGSYAPFYGYYAQPYFYPQYTYQSTYYWRPFVPMWWY